jgi:hypothetical protein
MIPPHVPGIGQDSGSPRPPFRLEEEAPEETVIRDLDLQIDDAESRGESAEHLIRERNSQYQAWISRLERESNDDKNQNRKDYLRGQLERAKRSYAECGSGRSTASNW